MAELHENSYRERDIPDNIYYSKNKTALQPQAVDNLISSGR